MHLKNIMWFNLYNEIKAKKYIKKKLQNKYTKFELNINLKKKKKKWLKISEKIFFKKIMLSKKEKKLDYFFNNFFLTDLFFTQYSRKIFTKQVIKFNLIGERNFNIETRLKSNKFDNFPNRVKRIHSSLINI